MENIENKALNSEKKIFPVVLSILQKIKAWLEPASYSSCSKQSIWTLSLVAFWVWLDLVKCCHYILTRLIKL
jgi:hypothetical protein